MKLLVVMMFKVTKIYRGPRKNRTSLWKRHSSSSIKYKDARLNKPLSCIWQEHLRETSLHVCLLLIPSQDNS